MYGYIYETTNLVNGKKYIGKHKSSKFDNWYLGSGIALTRSVKKYGKENFKVRIIEQIETNQDDLDLREMYWIKYFNAVEDKKYYNNSAGGKEEGWIGFNVAVKQNPKLHSMYGKKKSSETKEKISKALKGRKASDEVKKILSESHKGKKSPRKGVCLSQKTKDKLSQINKGKKLSEETKRKISKMTKGKNNPMYGKNPWNKGKRNVYTKDTLKKMSKSAKERMKLKIYNQNSANRRWINNDLTNKYVLKEEVEKYLLDGWKLGMKSRKDIKR